MVTFTAGDYFADEVNIYGDAEIKVSGQVYIHSNGTEIKGSGKVNLTGVPNDVYFVVHGSNAEFSIKGTRAIAFINSQKTKSS